MTIIQFEWALALHLIAKMLRSWYLEIGKQRAGALQRAYLADFVEKTGICGQTLLLISEKDK